MNYGCPCRADFFQEVSPDVISRFLLLMSALPSYLIAEAELEWLKAELEDLGVVLDLTKDQMNRQGTGLYREWKLYSSSDCELVIWADRPLESELWMLTIGPCEPSNYLYRKIDEMVEPINRLREQSVR